MRVLTASVVAALLLTACADEDVSQRQAVSVQDGLQAAGQFQGRGLSISDGEPEVLLGDCDPGDGTDLDLCIVARSVDGATVNLIVENPGALAADAAVEVRSDTCAGRACDAVGPHAVVDVRVAGQALRASAGQLRVEVADGERFAASFRLRFRDGSRLAGSFDVDPGRAPER